MADQNFSDFTQEASPATTDHVVGYRTAASGGERRTLLSAIYALFKTAYDAVYVTISGALGTPSSGTLTNCTGLPTGGLVDGAVTLAKMANLAQDQFIGRTTASTGVPETATVTAAARTVLDDTSVSAMVDTLGGASATGTGGLVRATSPTLVTPALGTPASGTLTNCTGLPSGGMVDGAVTLAKMANLAQDQFIGRTTASTGVPETATVTAAARTVLDDTSVSAMVDTLGGASATGTGGLVRATSPTLVTPVLGVAAATTINKVALTAPATGATVTVADGKTLTCTESTTLNRQSSTGLPVEFGIACSDETTAVTTGTAKATFRAPYAFTATAVRASVTTAPTGSTLVIDINETGTTILSTKLSIDVSEKTSTTAASAAVISDSAIADDAEITIDFDQVGSTVAGAGVKVWILGYR